MHNFVNEINDIINTDAVYSKNHFFFATHKEFKNLEYIPSGNDKLNSIKISEEDLLKNYLVKNLYRHSLITIQGDNGTGKSHLIKWLNNKMQEFKELHNDEIVFIKRDDATLKSSLKQLVSIDFFRENEDAKRKFDTLLNSDDIENEEKIIDNIIAQLAILMLDDQNECNEKLNSSERIAIRNFLVDLNVQEELLKKTQGFFYRLSQRLVEQSKHRTDDIEAKAVEEDFTFDLTFLNKLKKNEIDRRAQRIAEKIYENKDGYKNKVVDYINSLMEQAIQKAVKINTTDFIEVFKEIRRYLKSKDKNLIFLVEDITTMTGLDKALLEALRMEHGDQESDLCRLFSVIGITTAYYNELRSNYKDRITFRINLGDDVIFNSDEDVYTFASKYIQALFVDEKKYEEWYKNGAKYSQLPKPDYDKFGSWSLEQNNLLYPLNKKFVIRLFESLDVGMRTPRYFLKNVLAPVLELFKLNPYEFPPNLSDLRKIGINFNDWDMNSNKDELRVVYRENDFERFNAFILYYSDLTRHVTKSDNELSYSGLKESMYKEFGFDIQLKGQNVHMKKTNDDKEEKDDILKKPSRIVDPLKVEKTEINIKLDNLREELRKWINEKNDSIQLRSQRESLVEMILSVFDYSDYFMMPKQLKGAFTMRSIVLENSTSEINNDRIILKRNENSLIIIETAFNYKVRGNNSWQYEGAVYDLSNVISFIDENKSFFKSVSEKIEAELKSKFISVMNILLLEKQYSSNNFVERIEPEYVGEILNSLKPEKTNLKFLARIKKCVLMLRLSTNIELPDSISESEIREAVMHFSGSTGESDSMTSKDIVIDIQKMATVLNHEDLKNQELSKEINRLLDDIKQIVEMQSKKTDELNNLETLHKEIDDFFDYMQSMQRIVPNGLIIKWQDVKMKVSISLMEEFRNVIDSNVNNNYGTYLTLLEVGIVEISDWYRSFNNYLLSQLTDLSISINDKNYTSKSDVDDEINHLIELERRFV